MSSYKPVTASLRVLEVLAAINRLGRHSTVAGIHQVTGIDKATVVRMLETLIHAGYVLRERSPQPVYRPTGKTLTLGTGYDRHKVASAIVSNDLAQFRQQIGWPSDVALFDHDAMLVVETSRQAEPMLFYRASGYRAPVLQTSLGLAWLANCPEDQRNEFLARAAGDPAPQNEPARDSQTLLAKLEKIRIQGYATMDEAYSRQFYDSQFFGIGVAIISEGNVYGAVNAIYLRSALSEEKARNRLVAPLQDVARRMAIKLRDGFSQ